MDGPSACLVPAGKPGPFRTSVRWNAAVDRLSGATERHATACIEFREGCGLWTVVGFQDDQARDQWLEPVKAAFRLLADTGFGGERSRGWGRSETPEFVEGTLPGLIIEYQRRETPPTEEPEPPATAEPTGPTVEEARRAAKPESVEPAEPRGGGVAARQLRSRRANRAAPWRRRRRPPTPSPSSPPNSDRRRGAAARQPRVRPNRRSPLWSEAPRPRRTPSPSEPAEPDCRSERRRPPTAESVEPTEPVVGQALSPANPEPVAEPAPPGSRPNPNPSPIAAALRAPDLTEPLRRGTRAPIVPPPPVHLQAHWLLSLFTPAADDAVDWGRGSYTVLARGGRIDSPSGSGELKKQIQMVAEGSVLYADGVPLGAAADVAPDGFAHPVFRAGFALAIPLPEVH